MQALPAHFILLVGKANFAGQADQNTFANNELTQFGYSGLVNNPILGTFIPYTPLGAAVVWTPNKQNTVALIAIDADGDVKKAGFDTVFNGNTTYVVQYQFTPDIGGKLPGNYRFIYGYQDKSITNFAIGPRQLIGQIVGAVPKATISNNNHTVMFNFDQYLWVKEDSAAAYHQRLEASAYPGIGRHHLPPEGIGIFARAGWAPSNRNVIDQFYSIGIGGYGMILPNRPYDRWGAGYAATHVSSDLRRDVGLLGINLKSFEHALEAFYNFQLTPATHLTINAQVIKSPVKSRDTAFALSSQLQIDL